MYMAALSAAMPSNMEVEVYSHEQRIFWISSVPPRKGHEETAGPDPPVTQLAIPGDHKDKMWSLLEEQKRARQARVLP